MPRIRLASETDLTDGQSLKFSFRRGSETVDGFLARFGGKIVAYENLCRHLPLTLDYDDNRFFDSEGKFIICQTHGAMYHPANGRCIEGPCGGESLYPIEISLEDGVVWLTEADAEAQE
ncbi:MAG: nitrite reductase/ring-hydroxylating ferredoxin subunit [Candidatus Binatia bacterium]|jgi:nitrite reductase/ring-hydroxylating ferredoxin subunit